MDLLRSRRQALGGASCRALVELRAELLQSLVSFCRVFEGVFESEGVFELARA